MVRYDTPTDGISRKVFDRYRDKQTQRYARIREDELALQRRVKTLERLVFRLQEMVAYLADDEDVHPSWKED